MKATILSLAVALCVTPAASAQEAAEPEATPPAFQSRFERIQSFRERAESRRDAVRGALREWREEAGPPPQISEERRAFLRAFQEWHREHRGALPPQRGDLAPDTGATRGGDARAALGRGALRRALDAHRGQGRRCQAGPSRPFGRGGFLPDVRPGSGDFRRLEGVSPILPPVFDDGDGGFERANPDHFDRGFRRHVEPPLQQELPPLRGRGLLPPARGAAPQRGR